MITGRQYRAYPDPDAAAELPRWIGHQRFIYNAKVREDRYFRAFQKRALALAGIYPPVDQTYSHFIGPQATNPAGELTVPGTEWLREIPAQILRNGAVRFAQAYSPFFKGLARRPTIKSKYRRQSVWVTRELFSIEKCAKDKKIPEYLIRLGTKKRPAGTMRLEAHQPFKHLPASITISVEAGRWFVSFAIDDELPELSRDQIGEQLEKLTQQELEACTVGIDRNTPKGRQICASDGVTFAYSPQQTRRMRKKERARRRYQRRLSRQTKGSKSRRKTRRRLQRIGQYFGNVRRDFAHKTSRALVEDPKTRVIVFEDLKIPSMTRKPKAKRDENGNFLPNGAAAKAGLHSAILGSAWGKVHDFTRYKALMAAKLTVKVSPRGSSQECARCGHTHPDNRPSQAVFVCQRCGHTGNADDNAARIIKARGIELVRSGGWREKPPKKTMRLKSKSVGQELSEPGLARDPTPEKFDPRKTRAGHYPTRARIQDTGNPHYNGVAV